MSAHSIGGEDRRHPAQNWNRTLDFQLAECHGPDWAHLAVDRTGWRSRSGEWFAQCRTSIGGGAQKRGSRDGRAYVRHRLG